MNLYGMRVRDHYRKYLPKAYAGIEDPETFFTEIGETMEDQIEDLDFALRGPDPEEETFMERVSRFRWARFNAESQVMREFLPPVEMTSEELAEQETDREDEEELTDAIQEFHRLRAELYDAQERGNG